MRIDDGKGRGYVLSVNAENQVDTFSVIETHERRINRVDHKYWSLPFQAIDPAGADDYFIYLKNTGTKELAITDIRIATTVVGTCEVHHVTGTPSYTSDTDIAPVNRYLGSSTAPTMTAKTDTDTTGLTNEGILFLIDMPATGTTYHLSPSGDIFLPPGQAMALLWDQATGILSGVISVAELEVGL